MPHSEATTDADSQVTPISLPPQLVFDPATKLWSDPSTPSLAYSEGRAIEERLLTIINGASDRSAFSAELAHHATRDEIRYHLHPDRGNIASGLVFREGARILEVGAGCGAITRVLGEQTTGTVVAVEGAAARAEICAARVQDLDNTTVVAAHLGEVDFGPVFDVVVVIGVLEYAGKFLSEAEDPHRQFIRLCMSQLKPDGSLVVAIENQLGTKYLAGAREDHTGRRFDGVEGYPGVVNGPRTFGLAELHDLLGEHAASTDIALAFPDYKFPRFIATESLSREVNLSDMISAATAEFETTAMREELLIGTMARNRLTAETANSFLAFAHLEPEAPAVWLDAAAQLWSGRNPERPTRLTSVVRSDDGSLATVKRLEGSTTARFPSSDLVSWQPTADEWIEGSSLAVLVREELRAGGDVASCAALASQWREHLAELAHDDLVLPGAYLDATWSNSICGPAGIRLFDLEWVWAHPVPILFPLFRSVDNLGKAARVDAPTSTIALLPVEELREAFACALSIPINDTAHDEYGKMVSELNWVAFGMDRERTARADRLMRSSGRLWPAWSASAPQRKNATAFARRATRKISIEAKRRWPLSEK